MKTRKLKAILNNTGYAISNQGNKLCVGSPMCSDLINIDVNNLKVSYALDTFREGRKALERSNSELLFIWDKLHEIIDSREILDVINGDDEIENPLPVFTVREGDLIESVTDKYGWPNTDHRGFCMYDNSHFPTKEQAIKYGINENEMGVKWLKENVIEKEEELQKLKDRISQYEAALNRLKSMQ